MSQTLSHAVNVPSKVGTIVGKRHRIPNIGDTFRGAGKGRSYILFNIEGEPDYVTYRQELEL